MSGYILKLIAMVTMLIDHGTAILISPSHPLYIIGRSIGRLSFPIFCFLIVEGLLHTRNIKKYLFRLLMFAFISEIPFNFAFYNPRINDEHIYHQNIFFILFIGLLVISIIHHLHKYFQEKYYSNNIGQRNSNIHIIENILVLIVLSLGCLLANILNTDYSFVGVLMIWAFYTFKDNMNLLFVLLFLLNLVYGFPQILAMFSLIFIGKYNGQRGKQANKFLLYGFYPIHLIVLYFIRLLIL